MNDIDRSPLKGQITAVVARQKGKECRAR